MSERAAMAGDKGAPLTIEHKDRTYTFRPVITEGVMLAVEARLYDREKRAIAAQRDVMSEEQYMLRLDALRKRYVDGEFSFESKQTMETLQTKKGSLILLMCIADCTEADLLTLMTERPADLRDVLQTVMAISMPEKKVGSAAQQPKKKWRRAR